MDIEERLVQVRENPILRDAFIREYTGFILSAVSKSTKRFVTQEDDVFSVALIAFDEAITKYQSEKGSFLSFAELVIRSRVIDEVRREQGKHGKTVPFSSMIHRDAAGKEIEFEPRGEQDVVSDSVLEIQAVSAELMHFGISFSDLPHSMPKSRKTKRECVGLLSYMKLHPELIAEIRQKGNLPAKTLQEQCGAGKKLLERHRKYLIAAAMIIGGDYPILSQYIKISEEVEP